MSQLARRFPRVVVNTTTPIEPAVALIQLQLPNGSVPQPNNEQLLTSDEIYEILEPCEADANLDTNLDADRDADRDANRDA
jgi:hypothetical protein